MGALSLPSPGASCGPCAETCEHTLCATVRFVAERACDLCDEPNGYRVAIYAYSTRCGHADCIDGAYEKALFRFIDSLADIIAKDIWEERVKTVSAAPVVTASAASKRKRSRKSVAAEEVAGEEAEGNSLRYLLPEFDIDVDVPASASKSSKEKRAWRMRGKIG